MVSPKHWSFRAALYFVFSESDEGLHFVPKKEYIIDQDALREFFVFVDGVVVFWDMEKCEVILFVKALLLLQFHSFKEKSHVSKNRFYLDTSRYNGDLKSSGSILERYAFSHGMGASVKIGIWEAQLSEQAEPLALTTKALSKGVIPWKRKEALQKTGQFATLRHSINLNCDLLDTDFYWERENLETFYYMAFHHFSVPKRLKLLNSRLDYCEQLVRIVDGMLCDRHVRFILVAESFRNEGVNSMDTI
ncbi:unnamed protein product [Enterobius vermicularis]|uniref:DUF155 domain-containing protein n=1 Tax=Enterobius vermicularis TaxID=51028 RepID=A0A3P6IYR2_ENTVE|nr:unnamed protein product [Enterobius vermicularis]